MPRRALRCIVELDIHAVSCPGVWLPRREDVYLSISLLGQSRRTHLTSPSFPLYFQQKFFFDKVFYTCYNPSQVAETLEDELVVIELVQLSEFYQGGRLLAAYQTNARDFLYPYPQFSPTYSAHDRELLLERSMDFPGIAPKLEFASKTTLEETKIPVINSLQRDAMDDLADEIAVRRSRIRRGRSRSRQRSRQYRRPTVSSVYRSRSASPCRLYRHLQDLDISDEDIRPPFVVSKVKEDLIGRRPGSPCRRQRITLPDGSRARSPSPTRFESSGALRCLDDYVSVPRTSKMEGGSYLDDTDTEVLEILSDKYIRPAPPVYARPRSKSPLLYRPSLHDRFETASYSPLVSHSIADRVDRALRRNRSLDRLDCLKDELPYWYDSLDELEDDLDWSRYRRCASNSPLLFWRARSVEVNDKDYRDIFNKNLCKIYTHMCKETLSKLVP